MTVDLSQSDIEQRSSPILPYMFSTSEIETGDQFEAWRQLVDPMLDASLPHGHRPSGYRAEMKAWHLGNMIISRELFSAVNFQLRPESVRKTRVDHWFLTLNRAGKTTTFCNDTVDQSEPGALRLRSLTRPFEGQSSDSNLLFLYLPRDLYTDISGRLDALRNVALSGPMIGLLSDFLLSLERRLPMLTEVEVSATASALKAMVSACLVPDGKDDRHSVAGAVNEVLADRVRRYIGQNLSMPHLGPEHICETLGLSRSKLYRHFEASGGVMREIRQQRLLASKAALVDRADTRPIYRIAEDCGFASAEDFSKAFRRQFGLTPGDLRRLAARNHQRMVSPQTADFGRWLLELGR